MEFPLSSRYAFAFALVFGTLLTRLSAQRLPTQPGGDGCTHCGCASENRQPNYSGGRVQVSKGLYHVGFLHGLYLTKCTYIYDMVMRKLPHKCRRGLNLSLV